jgi:excinuclease UvrABC helicase subunit UvrB
VRESLQPEKVAEEIGSYGKPLTARDIRNMSLDETLGYLAELEGEMKQAAKSLDFERAATLRDELARVKALLPSAGISQRPPEPKPGAPGSGRYRRPVRSSS